MRTRNRLDIPTSWQQACDTICTTSSLSIVIGPVDSGKSTFCMVLANHALTAGRRPALIDTDPGQSDVGPPATLGMMLVRHQMRYPDDTSPAALHFIGATTPVGHLADITAGVVRLTHVARDEGADLLIVNTSGLVTGPGRALKASKIAALTPDHVVSIAPNGETDAILKNLRRTATPTIHRLLPSQHARTRNAIERKQRRERQFSAYFHDAQQIVLNFQEIRLQGGIWQNGVPFDTMMRAYCEGQLDTEIFWGERTNEGVFLITRDLPRHADIKLITETFRRARVIPYADLQGLLVGLIGADSTHLGMGIIETVDFAKKTMTLRSPMKDTNRITVIHLGSMRLSPSGIELGNVSAPI
jgi:polynucleotide 5'-hydroxyl-kinase GRC3/NOL9